jgi:hypothetical protein
MGTSYIATIRYEQPYITIISRPPYIAQYHIVCIVDHTGIPHFRRKGLRVSQTKMHRLLS